jgi:prepilin-type N-terminal cleavage/methylation domain-containing protein
MTELTMVKRQRGFSLLEIIIAVFISLMALLGILYLYKAQHKNMNMQSSITEMRMNGQFCLNEVQYYLTHAGLGLPQDFKNLTLANGELVVGKNATKRSTPAIMDPSSGNTETIYQIARVDTGLFTQRSYAVASLSGGAKSAEIKDIKPNPGVPSEALVILLANKAGFPASTDLYPLEKTRIHLGTGIGADTAAGDFKIMEDNPGPRAGNLPEILTLAENIESITYRYFMLNRDSVDALPARLDSLQRIELTVVAKTRQRDKDKDGDGYQRQTLKAKIGYRRSL